MTVAVPDSDWSGAQDRETVAPLDWPAASVPPPPPVSGAPADADHLTVPPDALTPIVQLSPELRTPHCAPPTDNWPALGLVRVGVGVGVRRVRVGVGVADVGVGVGVSLSVGDGDSEGSSDSGGELESGTDDDGPPGVPWAFVPPSGESDMTK